MFNLGQYLHQLLLIHQQVGVPGIGIISKVRIAAKFDEQHHTFLPPTHTYALIQHAITDETLVRHVAKMKQLSEENARQEVDKAVDQLLVDISDKGEAKLDEIGYLKEARGVYILLPFEQSSWGLRPVEEYTKPAPAEHPILDTPADTIVATEVPVESEMAILESPIEERKGKNWLVWGGAALLVLAAAFFYIWNKTKKEPTASGALTAQQNKTAPLVADSLQDTTSKLDTSLTNAQTSDSLQANPVAPKKEDPLVRAFAKRPPFTIVLASFKTMDLAIKQAQYFRTIGIDAFVLESNMPNNRKKICYGNYATKTAAQGDLEKIRNEIDQAAYIYP